MKKFLALICLFGALGLTASAQQTNTSFQQQWFFNTTVANVSEPGVAEQSLASVHTVTWTVTGTVVGTMTLQTSSVSQTGTWATMTNAVAQNLATSGSYTLEGQSAAFVGMAINISTCTACTVNLVYVGTTPAVGTFTDGMYNVPLTSCLWNDSAALGAAPTGTTNPGFVRIAANNPVFQIVGSAAASSYFLECDMTPPGRITSGKGITITEVDVFYAIQTTALTSITTPTLASETFVAQGAAAGATTVAAFGGTLAVLPASLQLTTTTSGQCFHETVVLGTPTNPNTLTGFNLGQAKLTFEQIFGQTAASAETIQLCGLAVYYNSNIL